MRSKPLVILPPVEFVIFGHRDVEGAVMSLRLYAEQAADQTERKCDDSPQQLYDDKSADYSKYYTEHDLTSHLQR